MDERDMRVCEVCGEDKKPNQMRDICGPTERVIHACGDCVEKYERESGVEFQSDDVGAGEFMAFRKWVHDQQNERDPKPPGKIRQLRVSYVDGREVTATFDADTVHCEEQGNAGDIPLAQFVRDFVKGLCADAQESMSAPAVPTTIDAIVSAVVFVLNGKGICAVNEYPGYVAIYLADGNEWTFGDEADDGMWTGIRGNAQDGTHDETTAFSADFSNTIRWLELVAQVADAIEKHIRPFGGLLRVGSEKVLRAFNQALEKAKEADEAHKAKRLFAEDVHDAAQELQNKAFEVAKSLGWDWENVEEGQFASWCLKATETEIVEEGLKRFKKWSTMACGLTVAG